jgi:hypothetical protein
MIFTSKYNIGQIVEFSSDNNTKCGEITGVMSTGSAELLYEIGDLGFLEESRITATFTREPIQKPEPDNGQLELPEVMNV